jgi:hypothetical protein
MASIQFAELIELRMEITLSPAKLPGARQAGNDRNGKLEGLR